MNQKKQNKQLAPLLVLLLVVSMVLGFGTKTRYPGFFQGEFKPIPTPNLTSPNDVDWGKLEAVKTRIDNHYNGPIVESSVLEGALKGMVNSLEGGGQFFNAREYSEIKGRSQNSRGTGIHIGVQEGRLVVLRTDDNSQGFKSGILPGDLILKINGRVYTGNEIETARNLMYSSNRSSVDLQVLREREVKQVKVRLRLLTSQTVRGILYQGVAIISLPNFQNESTSDFDRILNNLIQAGGKSLILDLRDLPSGQITEAVEFAKRFVPNGEPIMAIRDTKGNKRLFVSDDGKFAEIPLVVLINERTEGTAEFVAGALQKNTQTELIGQTTIGDGRVYAYIDLPDGEGIKLVTGYFLLPDGGEIHGQGIKPATSIPSSLRYARNLIQRNDRQMKVAIEKAVQRIKK